MIEQKNPPAPQPRTVRCPACGGASLFAPENPWRPFCSERCKNLDFGAWASETYRVEDRPDPRESLDDTDTPPH
ncbi:DNA gyrase inhibitor YacG [Aquabacterium sp. A7-Y]|uniref:DNA gyrase inhibitor YacG n=1 Tax=Aquabacterium sp. A7-Y TaxID=1349605 RepID=UPI00223D2D5A|nr:DNA gyrase inhibitor YacG [Aquabacterium sp. A7-Y]MCW7537169.1 DNA gyrase inhibitor YacG [Aquabacterium sp. A7-Y]